MDPDELVPTFSVRRGPRPSDDGRVPLDRTPVSNTSVRRDVPVQRPALSERRPRRLSSSFNGWAEPSPNPKGGEKGRTDVLWARRAVRRQAATNACARSRRTSHRRQAIGDRLSFCRHSAASRSKLSICLFVWAGGWVAFVSLCLCVCDVGGWVGGICVYLRYLRFEMGWWLCALSVSL